MLNKSAGRPRGRPRGHPATKARITAAARELFREHGYRGTTVRAIAAAADVDSALISYHFGSKQALFGQALRLPCLDAGALERAMRGDRAGLPDRLLDAVTSGWDGAGAAESRLALQDEATMAALRDFLDGELIVRLAEFLGGPDATRRAAAAAGVLGGVIFTRYLNPLRPIAGLTPADVRAAFGPALRAVLATDTVRGRRPQRPAVAAPAAAHHNDQPWRPSSSSTS